MITEEQPQKIEWKTPPMLLFKLVPVGHVWFTHKGKVKCFLGDCCDELIERMFEVLDDH